MMTQDTTYAFTVSVGTYDMQFNDRGAAERAATQYGTTVKENWKPADKMCGWCGQANDYRNTHCVKCGAEL